MIEDKIIRSLRIENGISLKALAEGLCSTSMLLYIERGEKETNAFVKNRLFERLGLSTEDFAFYVYDDEFQIYEKQRNIIRYLINGEINSALEVLESLPEVIKDDDNINKQFYCNFKSIIQKIQGKDEYEKWLEAALFSTLNKNYFCCKREYVLSYKEYFIAIKYCEGRIQKGEIEYIEHLIEIIEIIMHSQMEIVSKVKVLPFAVNVLYEGMKKHALFDDKRIKNFARDTFFLLKKAGRINGVRNLLTILLEVDRVNKDEYIKDFLLFEMLKDVSGIIDVSDEIALYMGQDIYSFSEIIKKRRLMIGMSQNELAKGICSIKTLSRIEKGETNIQAYILDFLMKRLKLTSERLYMPIYFDSIEQLNVYWKYLKAINTGDEQNRIRYFKYLEENIDLSIDNNEFFFLVENTVEKYRNRELSRKEYLDELKEIIKPIVDLDKIECCKEVFLTPYEKLVLRYYLGALIEEDQGFTSKALDLFALLKKHNCIGEICDIEEGILMLSVVNLKGSLKEFDMAKQLAKNLLRWFMNLGNVFYIHYSLYEIIWNSDMEGLINQEEKNKLLDMCIGLCEFSNNKMYKEFYESRRGRSPASG